MHEYQGLDFDEIGVRYNGRETITNALVDSASTHTLITKALAERIGMKPDGPTFDVKTGAGILYGRMGMLDAVWLNEGPLNEWLENEQVIVVDFKKGILPVNIEVVLRKALSKKLIKAQE